MFAPCAVVKLFDIITYGSAEVAKRPKRKSSDETLAPPPTKKPQGPVVMAKVAKSTLATQPKAVRLQQLRSPHHQHQKGWQLKESQLLYLLTAEANS